MKQHSKNIIYMFAYFKILAVKLLLRFVPSAITALEWILQLSTTSAAAPTTTTTTTTPTLSSSPTSALPSSSPVRDSPGGSLRERKLSRQASFGAAGGAGAGSFSSAPGHNAQQQQQQQLSQRKYSLANSNLARRPSRAGYSLQILDKLKPTAVISDLSEPFENLFTVPNDLFSFTNLVKTLLLEITFLARLYRLALSVRERCRTMFRWKPTSPEDLDQAEKKIFSYLKCNYKGYYVDIGKAWDLDNVRIWTIELPRVDRAQKLAASAVPNPMIPPTILSKPSQPTFQHHQKAKISVASTPETQENLPLVMIHGFAAGVGFWTLNFDELAEYGNRTIYAFDVLGFAKSSRPNFTFPKFCHMTALQRSKAEAEKMEEYMVESIEKWRKAIGGPLANKFILLGHSFGAYLSLAYALRHPEHVSHLILADPWGLPPENHSRHMSSTHYTSSRQLPFWMKALAKLFLGVFTPLSLLRALGPWGPGLIHRLRPDIRKKFQRLTNDALDDENNENTQGSDADVSSNSSSDDEIKAKVAKTKDDNEAEDRKNGMIIDYIYHCNAQSKPSGEIAFQKLCTLTAWARMPMLERIIDLESHISVTFIYGSRSWVDRQSGFQAKYILATAASALSPEEAANAVAAAAAAASASSSDELESGDEEHERVSVLILNGAGHHVYADMPEEFNQMVLKVCADVDNAHKVRNSESATPEETEDDDVVEVMDQHQAEEIVAVNVNHS